MSAKEKSDLPEVAEKRANKAASAAAELVERRGGAKENAELQSTRPRRSYRSSAGSRRAISVRDCYELFRPLKCCVQKPHFPPPEYFRVGNIFQ